MKSIYGFLGLGLVLVLMFGYCSYAFNGGPDYVSHETYQIVEVNNTTTNVCVAVVCETGNVGSVAVDTSSGQMANQDSPGVYQGYTQTPTFGEQPTDSPGPILIMIFVALFVLAIMARRSNRGNA